MQDHLRFVKQHGNKFKNFVFFFHGHEVLRVSQIYPKSYKFARKSPIIKKLFREMYDLAKLKVWEKAVPKLKPKSYFIFVSNWMYQMFLKHTKLSSLNIDDKVKIIYNCIGREFEFSDYDMVATKKYDFITIRSNLDGAKYGIDIVTRLAKHNTNYKFCVVGTGHFFNYYDKPDNIIWLDKKLSHGEIIKHLNESKCAFMPTRADAQGVMACEMATFGIPLITSNIDVCEEVFAGFDNVAFINNDDEDTDMDVIISRLQNIEISQKNRKYFKENTVDREIELFKILER